MSAKGETVVQNFTRGTEIRAAAIQTYVLSLLSLGKRYDLLFCACPLVIDTKQCKNVDDTISLSKNQQRQGWKFTPAMAALFAFRSHGFYIINIINTSLYISKFKNRELLVHGKILCFPQHTTAQKICTQCFVVVLIFPNNRLLLWVNPPFQALHIDVAMEIHF